MGNRWEDGSQQVTGLILLMATQRGEKQLPATENLQLSVSSLCPRISFRLLIRIRSYWDEKRQKRRMRSLTRHGNSPQPLVVLINSSFQADKFRPNNKCSAVVIAERTGEKRAADCARSSGTTLNTEYQ